jgi:nucleotide-binding universal stress UspA family protein
MTRSTLSGVPRHVLLATDLTPAADRAFDRAARLAESWGAKLTIFHVVEARSLRPWGIDRRVRHAETEMERLSLALDRREGLSRHIVIGDPAERVVEHARAIGADFVVTGPAHARALGDRQFGSTAARILKLTGLPLLSVRRRPIGPYTTVVAGVDLSPLSRDALRYGRRLFPAADFTVVHAYTLLPDLSGKSAERSLDEVEAAERARVEREAGKELADLVAAASAGLAATGRLESRLVAGSPEAVLLDTVEATWPELAVVGTHGRTGALEAVLGSVAEQVLDRLPCDVLAVKV